MSLDQLAPWFQIRPVCFAKCTCRRSSRIDRAYVVLRACAIKPLVEKSETLLKIGCVVYVVVVVVVVVVVWFPSIVWRLGIFFYFLLAYCGVIRCDILSCGWLVVFHVVCD